MTRTPPPDLDATRASIVARELVATASGYLTGDVAMSLPFEALTPFKTLLKRFFSTEPWGSDEVEQLARLVGPHIPEGWWEHDLGSGISLQHGSREGSYVLWVTGGAAPVASVFDRVFDGPVVPEATPHPRKVKFTVGGEPAPGRWYRRTDPDAAHDPRVERLFAEPDVTDVMVAGDFVTVGIGARSPWERRLEPLLALVTELFADPSATRLDAERTRDQLLDEADKVADRNRPEELHLLDPDAPADRTRLLAALEDDDPRVRRIAVAVLMEVSDDRLREKVIDSGASDESKMVRRATIDSAADATDERFRTFFERSLSDPDPWIRWKAVRSLGELGLASSRRAVEAVIDDPDFQVRFETAKVLREDG